MSDIKPIFDFKPLKETLSQLGYQVGEASPFTPHTEDLNFEQMQNLEFAPEFEGGGIKIKDDKGREYIGFLYKKRYFHEYQGRISEPKAHLCNCSTIQELGRDEYRFANSSPITYIDRSTGSERTIDHLDLCSHCRAMLAAAGHYYSSTEDYVQEMTEKYGSVGHATSVDVDINGYTRDWEKVSRSYREKRNWCCEKCGWTPSNVFDRRFIQVHHKNKDKADNSDQNLQCLCIECHSKVDDLHRENFSLGANAKMLAAFRKLKLKESSKR